MDSAVVGVEFVSEDKTEYEDLDLDGDGDGDVEFETEHTLVTVDCLQDFQALRKAHPTAGIAIGKPLQPHMLSTHFIFMEGIPFLSIKDCANLTDFTLTYLGLCDSLQSLNISGCKKITDAGIQNLSSTNLRRLDMAGMPHITEKAYEHLATIASLKSLHICKCMMARISNAEVLHWLLQGVVTVTAEPCCTEHC